MSKIWISLGTHHKSKTWKNVQTQWENILERLKAPKVTPETYAEYLAMSKEKQVEVKDVGGFVGGVVAGGRRLKNSVSARYLVTLDIDEAPYDFWDDFTLLYDVESALYTTHKHSKTTPRFRLLMPLDREVMADEYEAISRKVAAEIGIELFDPTTFQPERLMFWPSVSVDGEYLFRDQKGARLNADEVLARYADWKDTSQWVYSSKAKARIKAGIDRQENPREKKGIIGVFCRVYGIEAAVEKYLKGIYEEAGDGRYTFVKGSTHAGMVVYDDLFSFSHHSTDPTNGRLCNSFDLVRIHLYGELDDAVQEGTPSNRRPSFVKMTELISKDGETKKMLVREQVKGAKGEFGGKGDEDIGSVDWADKLEVDKKGRILNTIANVIVILENDEALRETLCYDDFSKIDMLKRDLPWRKIGKYSTGLTDSDDAGYRNYLEAVYQITNRLAIRDAIEIVVHKNVFHPVKSYLESVVWDGTERIDTFWIDFLGAEDSVYTREVTRKTLVAAVARIYEPGIKFDNVPVLVGPQGIGKSRFVKALGMEWFSDTFGSLHNNAAMENIQGVWIMEIGELAGLKRQEVETIKLFISKQVDKFRVAYGKRVDTFARSCIFIGTTNDATPLQDPSGGRRFWPVLVKKVGYINQWLINQIWAEACHWYTMGEDLYLSQEVEDMAKSVQEEYTEQDERWSDIVRYLDLKVPNNWYEMNVYERVSFIQGNSNELVAEGIMLRDYITVPEIWTELMRGLTKDMTSHNTKYIRTIMNKLTTWEPKLINRKPYGTQRGWIRVQQKQHAIFQESN